MYIRKTIDKELVVKRLRNLIRKWKGERTKEESFQSGYLTGNKPSPMALERSEGHFLGVGSCLRDLQLVLGEIEDE